jgi:hypothetical protein
MLGNKPQQLPHASDLPREVRLHLTLQFVAGAHSRLVPALVQHNIAPNERAAKHIVNEVIAAALAGTGLKKLACQIIKAAKGEQHVLEQALHVGLDAIARLERVGLVNTRVATNIRNCQARFNALVPSSSSYEDPRMRAITLAACSMPNFHMRIRMRISDESQRALYADDPLGVLLNDVDEVFGKVAEALKPVVPQDTSSPAQDPIGFEVVALGGLTMPDLRAWRN